MQRYFIKNKQIKNNQVYITDQDFHHIKNVMRMKKKQKIEICDELQNLYLGEINEILNDVVIVDILEKMESLVEIDTDITIAFGLTRKDKQEEVLRRITELGAIGFVPVEMERSVVKLVKDKNKSLERMETIVKEAAEQSHRTRLLKVYEALKFDEFLEFSKQFDILVYAYEEAGKQNDFSFKKIIPTFRNKKVLILVGPEGGFSEKEVKILDERNFCKVGLGPRILRCETAPLYIMSAISYELELKI